MKNPYQVVKDFEEAVAGYCGSPYAVAVSSCTEALMLACAYHKVDTVSIPKRTYVGVPMAIMKADGRVIFDDREWIGEYTLAPYPIVDSAKLMTSGMYRAGEFRCISMHWTKTLNVGWGGVILHDSRKADRWLRKARFDGRTEGVKPTEDDFDVVGWHCIMSPAQAAEAWTRLLYLPKHNDPIPDDGYADLSKIKLFQ